MSRHLPLDFCNSIIAEGMSSNMTKSKIQDGNNLNIPGNLTVTGTIIGKDEIKTVDSNNKDKALLNTINIEERNDYIRKQQQNAIEEEKKLAQCPVSKQVNLMKLEIQDLKMEIQKIKNNTPIITSQPTTNTINKCPYSMFRLEDYNINQNKVQETDDLYNEITETYTSSFSWWSTIMFIVFILFVLKLLITPYFSTFLSCNIA